MKNREIEVRFLNIDKEKLVNILKSLSAVDKGESVLSEIIFYDQNLEWLKENRFVRLRTIGSSSSLTYKQNKLQTIDSAHEIEFSISDSQLATSFLENIGLRAYRHQEKRRHTFILKDITIDIDTWPRIPTYVEFEGTSESQLKSFIKSIGYDWSDAVFDDARMILEKRYKIPMGTMKYITFDKFE